MSRVILNSLWRLVPVLATFLAVSCASAEESTSVEQSLGDAITSRQLHELEQSAVAQCMREAGFDYSAPNYLDVSNDEIATTFFAVDRPDEIGYGLTVQAIVRAFIGAPAIELEDDASEAERLRYVEVLSGSVEAGSDSGCLGVGHESRVAALEERGALATPLNREWIRDGYDRTQAEPEYAEFVDAWQECMAKAGLEPASGPTGQLQSIAQELRPEIATALEDLRSDDNAMRHIDDLSSMSEVGLADLLVFVNRHAELRALLDAEIELAKIDEECRRLHRDEVQAVFEVQLDL